jgi:exonuclease III
MRKVKAMAVPSEIKLASLNVNGLPSKREQVAEFIEKECITVCALQETLVSAKQYPVHVPGFRTYARNWQDGFRGQAVLVHSSLPSYEVPHVKEKFPGYEHLLHVKVAHVSGLEGPSRSLHFVGVYFPLEGSMQANRSCCFMALRHLYDGIL